MKTSKGHVSPRTLARFQRAAARYGGKVLRAEWEPLGVHMVFEGPTGGWYVKVVFPGRYSPYRTECIGYNVGETVDDICYQGREAHRYLKRPNLTVPKDEKAWHALTALLYRDTRDLMQLQTQAVTLKDGDNKGAWEIVKALRTQDQARLEEALKEAVI